MIEARHASLLVSIGAEAAASVRAWRLRAYPWFMAYCAATLIQDACWIAAWPTSTAAYKQVWYVGTWIRLGLQVAMIAEAARLLKVRYPGIEVILPRLAALVATSGLVLAAVGSVDVFRPFPDMYFALYTVTRYSGSVFLVVTAFLAGWSAFFSYGVPPNLRHHATILAVYFLGSSGLYILAWWRLSFLASYAIAAVYVVWASVMRPEGEIAPPMPEPVEDGSAERIEELGKLGDELVRRARAGR